MSKSRLIVLIGSFVVVVVLIAGWFLLLAPRMATASDLNTQREEVVAKNETTTQTIARLETMKENIGEAKAQADALTKRFPPSAEESALFALVKQAAAQAGIPEKNVSDLTPGVPAVGLSDGAVTLPTPTPTSADPNAAPAPGTPPSEAAPTRLGTMTLDVTVAASKAQIVHFLKALEALDRSYLIKTVSLGASGTKGGSGATATVTGTMFLLPELVDPTAPAADPVDAPATPTP